MKPRPDDFERADAEHYLGAPSVAVSAHENLLAEPGAASQDPSQPAQTQSDASGGWGEAQQHGAASPYAPPSTGSPAAPAAPVTSTPWSSPPAQGPSAPSWEEPAAPSAPAPPPQSWDPQPPAAAAPGGAAQGWAPPETAPGTAEAPPAPHDQGGANPPSDLTGDAWGGDDGVDEQTRLTAVDDPLGDLEQTRISAVQLPAIRKLRLTTDDGSERIVEKPVVIGRNPAAPGEEVLFVMKDDTRSVSKTHLRIDGTGEDIIVTDLGSTNGSTILREDGSRENLVPD